jgi:F-type H+-transporting ATPase subunit b
MRVSFKPAAIVIAAIALPSAARAGQTMPQFQFTNPLVISQVVWMTGIMLVLYAALSRWALPKLSAVLENRAAIIARDLEAARLAKTEAEAAVKALNATMNDARNKAQAEIARAVSAAKAKALENSKALAAKLNAQLEYSEKVIAEARAEALAAIKPVAANAAETMLARLTGQTPDPAALAPQIEAAYAAAGAA